MFKKLIIFLILTLTLMTSKAYALNYFRFRYKIEPGESLTAIFKKFIKDYSYVNIKTPFVLKTIQGNPQITSWNALPANEILELYISTDYMNIAKYRLYEASKMKKFSAVAVQLKKPIYPTGLKGSVFYLCSLGMFTQKADTQAEVKFNQTSPLTMGGSFTYFPPDESYSFSYSAYLSLILPADNTLTNEKTAIPPEFGINSYAENRWQKYNVILYTGGDIERFSLFNLSELQNNQKVYIDTVNALYLTLGMAKSFTMFDEQYFIKTSIARSIITTYSTNAPASSETSSAAATKYSGYRFLFYLNYKFNEKLYFHSLFKYHTMTGPSTLTTIRIGAGFGYILF